MTQKSGLTKKMFRGLLVLSIVIILATLSVVTYEIYTSMMQTTSEKALGCAKTIAETIDGDTVPEYMDTKKRDKYYYLVREQLIAMKEHFGLMYCYVYIPDDEGLCYVWDADDEDENCIGIHDPYSDHGKEISMKVFSQHPEYDFLTDSDVDYGDFMATAAPIYNSAGEPVALVGVDISIEFIREYIITTVVKELAVIMLIMMLSFIIYYDRARKNLINPIAVVTKAAGNMVNDITKDEEISIDVHTNDEVESLARTFEKMHKELRTYITENTRIIAEKERIGAELDMAKEIQAGQLPSIFPAFPERAEFDIYASMTPAKEVGGDFYDFFFIDDDHLALVIADVSGKGIPAALFMMMSKILINNYAMMGLSPHEVLEHTNATICKNNEQGMFVTVWFGILELSTGKVTAANAGHEYPILRHPDGKFELFKDKHGFVIGGIKNKKYKEYEFTLEKGGTLFVYTDGVPEATDKNENMFGTQRMVDVLNTIPDAAPKELLEKLHSTVDGFVGDAPQFDDLTMLGIKLL